LERLGKVSEPKDYSRYRVLDILQKCIECKLITKNLILTGFLALTLACCASAVAGFSLQRLSFSTRAVMFNFVADKAVLEQAFL
jgi:hypothetical protein